MGLGAAILPAGQIFLTCPRLGCEALTGLEVLGDPRQPPRWWCVSGHSGYFQVAEPLNGGGSRAAPPGEVHSSRGRVQRCCSECGNPVGPHARKCAACRSHG
jgi:hypothetical protein